MAVLTLRAAAQKARGVAKQDILAHLHSRSELLRLAQEIKGLTGERARLVHLATHFRRAVHGDRSSEGLCFIVSWPLAAFLERFGYKPTLEAGSVQGRAHCWLGVGLLVVDATADQFTDPDGRPMPPVFVGICPPWYSPDFDNSRCQ